MEEYISEVSDYLNITLPVPKKLGVWNPTKKVDSDEAKQIARLAKKHITNQKFIGSFTKYNNKKLISTIYELVAIDQDYDPLLEKVYGFAGYRRNKLEEFIREYIDKDKKNDTKTFPVNYPSLSVRDNTNTQISRMSELNIWVDYATDNSGKFVFDICPRPSIGLDIAAESAQICYNEFTQNIAEDPGPFGKSKLFNGKFVEVDEEINIDDLE